MPPRRRRAIGLPGDDPGDEDYRPSGSEEETSPQSFEWSRSSGSSRPQRGRESAAAAASSSKPKRRPIRISDDEDEEEEEEERPRRTGKARAAASSARQTSHKQKKKRRKEESDDEEESDDDDDRFAEADMADERFVADSTDAHGKCEAADEITGEVLLSKHVVWRSPDGSHTMRFNLSTLRKIAARAGEWRGPPHFRSKMDEGMKAQILRKFGKRALFAVWNGGGPGSASQAPGGSVGSDGSSSFIRGGEDYAAEDGYFMQQLAEFDARRLTDVHNLYVCPICFHWLRNVEPEPEEQFEPAAALRRRLVAARRAARRRQMARRSSVL